MADKSYYLDNAEWKLQRSWEGHLLPDVPLPSIETRYKIGNTVTIKVDGLNRTAKIVGIECHLWDKKIKDGWVIYYDIKWTGSHHPRGYFKEHEINS